jgi:hypothetical protein
METTRYPLRVAPGGRHLTDQEGVPRFVNGDTAWSMVVSVLPDAWESYFSDRAAKGFTAVIVNAIERLFTADPPRTIDGVAPFTTPGDLGTPNETYFARVDALLAAASRHGIEIYLAPLYLGYVDPNYPGFGFSKRPEGWHDAVVAGGVETVRAYGRYVGRRWRDVDNLTWVIGGDRNPADVIEHMRAFVAGILEEDDRHLVTAHVHPDEAGAVQYKDDAWLTLNQTYTYQIVHRRLLEDYTRVPARPFVLFESTYEGEHDAPPVQIRRQAWWALTCGAAGQFLGNFPVWLMSPGWEAALDSPGARAMTHLRRFVDGVRWWDLVPDTERAFLVGGLGGLMDLDRATAALAADGSLAVVYMPTPRAIVVDLARLTGWVTRIRWFEADTGRWVDAGVITRRGVLQLTPPGDGDWALVLEDPAAGRHGAWAADR